MAGIFNSRIFNNAIFNTGPAEQSSGGYEYALRAPRRRTAQEIRDERRRLGIITREAQAVIDAVAERQAGSLKQDEQQRFEELERELKLSGIEWETRYLEAMNAMRERLISDEIGRRLRARAIEFQNRQTMMAMLLLE